MTGTTPACIIGLDMGTTNTRAWCIVGGEIVDSARAGVGIRDAAVAGDREVIRTAVRGIVADLVRSAEVAGRPPPEAVAAAGMITSDHGLAEVPHLAAPAGVEEIAAGVQCHRWPEISRLPIYLVPGVRTGEVAMPRERIAAADVMRGEETLCLGLRAEGVLPPEGVLVNLGSHWKVIQLDAQGRIARSTTSLAGELLHAAQANTLLAGSVPAGRPERLDPDWVEEGAGEARRSGLERALFCVRLLEQRTPSTGEERLSYLVGAFVGSATTWLVREIPPGAPVVIAGGGPVATLVAQALEAEVATPDPRVLAPAEVEGGMARGLALLTGLRMEAAGDAASG